MADSHYEVKKSHFQSLIVEVTFDRLVNLLVRGIRIGHCQTLMAPPGAPRGWGLGVVEKIFGIQKLLSFDSELFETYKYQVFKIMNILRKIEFFFLSPGGAGWKATSITGQFTLTPSYC